MNDFSEEYVENYEQKCLCVLVLDVSNLLGPAQIAEMNKSLQEFYKIIQEDETTSQRMEFCIITYGEGVSIIQEPCTVERFSMPAIPSSKSLPAVTEAINEAIGKVDARKRWYKETGQIYYRPMIVLVSKEKYTSVYESPLYEILKRDISEDIFVCKFRHGCDESSRGMDCFYGKREQRLLFRISQDSCK